VNIPIAWNTPTNPFAERALTEDEARLARQMIIKGAATDWEARAHAAEWRLHQLKQRIDLALVHLDRGNPHMAAVVLAEMD
jgi:hypothetical protein